MDVEEKDRISTCTGCSAGFPSLTELTLHINQCSAFKASTSEINTTNTSNCITDHPVAATRVKMPVRRGGKTIQIPTSALLSPAGKSRTTRNSGAAATPVNTSGKNLNTTPNEGASTPNTKTTASPNEPKKPAKRGRPRKVRLVEAKKEEDVIPIEQEVVEEKVVMSVKCKNERCSRSLSSVSAANIHSLFCAHVRRAKGLPPFLSLSSRQTENGRLLEEGEELERMEKEEKEGEGKEWASIYGELVASLANKTTVKQEGEIDGPRELSELLPSEIQLLVKELGITKSDTFFHIGSGKLSTCFLLMIYQELAV